MQGGTWGLAVDTARVFFFFLFLSFPLSFPSVIMVLFSFLLGVFFAMGWRLYE